jgi:hypothetical protein
MRTEGSGKLLDQPAKIRLSRDKRNRTLVSTMDGEAIGIEAERFYRDEPNRSTERCVSKRITSAGHLRVRAENASAVSGK